MQNTIASQDSLVKYYDCLKDSFNKIQGKDNKLALVNAALRPKIQEELIRSKDVLVSYLNYLQVFTPIYHDKFGAVCTSIICPLFRDQSSDFHVETEGGQDDHENMPSNSSVTANLIHKAIREMLKSEPELIEEYVYSVVKSFPSSYSDSYDVFINYMKNSLEISSYVRGEPLTMLFSKLFEKINPTIASDYNNEERLKQSQKCVKTGYELIYKRLESLEKRQLENVGAAMLAAFSRDFLVAKYEDSLNYLILYICSLDDKLIDLFINLMWAVFTNSSRPLEERRASVYYVSSFMSRANYVDMDKVLNFIETAVTWCNSMLNSKDADSATTKNDEPSLSNESSQLFFSLVESILYLLTQRYREMYEKESIERIKCLDLDKILESPLKPLEVCDIETEQRFRELSTLYEISSLRPSENSTSARKRRKSDQVRILRSVHKLPFKETDHNIPEHVKSLYRNYYDHRNFTIYRE